MVLCPGCVRERSALVRRFKFDHIAHAVGDRTDSVPGVPFLRWVCELDDGAIDVGVEGFEEGLPRSVRFPHQVCSMSVAGGCWQEEIEFDLPEERSGLIHNMVLSGLFALHGSFYSLHSPD